MSTVAAPTAALCARVRWSSASVSASRFAVGLQVPAVSAATAAAVSQWQEETRVREARRHAAVHVMPGVVPDFA